MAGRVIGEADVDVRANTQGMGEQASRDVKKELGGALKGAGLAVGAMLGGAILGALSEAITAASDLNETASAVSTIFGSGADAILKFSKEAAKSLGQSQQAALDGAKTFATYGKMANLSGQQLVDFSTNTLKLASDLASFNNTSPEEAIEAIGAAFRGESDPIEKYGVLLNEAGVQAEAFKMGLIKTSKDALSPQQRVLAVLSLIYKQTADAQNDFAKTSTGLANSQRIAKAEFENQKVILGQQLLPIFMKITAWLAKVVPPIIEWAKKNQILVASLAALVVVLWAVNIALDANPIVLIGLALIALVAGVIYAYNHFKWFKDMIDQMWVGAQRIGAFFAGPFVQFFRDAATWIVGAWNSVWAFFVNLPGQISAFVASIPQRLYQVFLNAFDLVFYVIGYSIGTVLKLVANLPVYIVQAVMALGPLLVGVLNWVWDMGQKAVSKGIDTMVSTAKALIPRLLDLFVNLAPRLLSAVQGALSSFYSFGQNIVLGMIDGITSMIGRAVDAVKRAVGNIVKGAKDALGISSPSKVFATLGQQSVAGYVKGIKSAAQSVAATVGGVIGGPALATATAGNTTSTDNSRAIEVNVYGGAGQSADEISAKVMRDLAWNEGV